MLLFNHTPSPPWQNKGGEVSIGHLTHTKKTWSKSALKVISSLFSKCCFLPIPPPPWQIRGGGMGGGGLWIQKLFSIIGFSLEFFSQLISTNRSWDSPPVYLLTMVTMGPVGLMKSTRKQKLIAIIGFFLEFFSQLILTTGSQNMSPDITVHYGIRARSTCLH